MGLFRPEHIIINGKVVGLRDVMHGGSATRAACSSITVLPLQQHRHAAEKDDGSSKSTSSPSESSSRGQASFINSLLDFAEKPPSPSESDSSADERPLAELWADQRSTMAPNMPQRELILEATLNQAVTHVEEAGAHNITMKDEAPASEFHSEPLGAHTLSEGEHPISQGSNRDAAGDFGTVDVHSAFGHEEGVKKTMSDDDATRATQAQETPRLSSAAALRRQRKHIFSPALHRLALLRHMKWLKARAARIESRKARKKQRTKCFGSAALSQNRVVVSEPAPTNSQALVAAGKLAPVTVQSLAAVSEPPAIVQAPMAAAEPLSSTGIHVREPRSMFVQTLLAQTIQAASVGAETTQAQADLLTAVEEALAADHETPEQAALLSVVEEALAADDIAGEQVHLKSQPNDEFLARELLLAKHASIFDAEDWKSPRKHKSHGQDGQGVCNALTQSGWHQQQDQEALLSSQQPPDAPQTGFDAQTPAWKRFTPSVIAPDRCMARIWNGGIGGQCRNNNVTYETYNGSFCAFHSARDTWRIHGRVDGPIPAMKLAEFQKCFKRREAGSNECKGHQKKMVHRWKRNALQPRVIAAV